MTWKYSSFSNIYKTYINLLMFDFVPSRCQNNTQTFSLKLACAFVPVIKYRVIKGQGILSPNLKAFKSEVLLLLILQHETRTPNKSQAIFYQHFQTPHSSFFLTLYIFISLLISSGYIFLLYLLHLFFQFYSYQNVGIR